MNRILLIIGIFWSSISYCQEVAISDLIISAMKFYEANPTHIENNEIIFNKFSSLIQDTTNSKHIDKTEIFNLLYDNGYYEFEDDNDIIRMKLRQALCFASIAILSDKDRFDYFMDVALNNISYSTNTPIKFLEKQYCGLILTRIYLKKRFSKDFQYDINQLDTLLETYKSSIDTDFYKSTKLIIKKFQ